MTGERNVSTPVSDLLHRFELLTWNDQRLFASEFARAVLPRMLFFTGVAASRDGRVSVWIRRDEGRVIAAIKTFRDLTGAGLKEAKDAVDRSRFNGVALERLDSQRAAAWAEAFAAVGVELMVGETPDSRSASHGE